MSRDNARHLNTIRIFLLLCAAPIVLPLSSSGQENPPEQKQTAPTSAPRSHGGGGYKDIKFGISFKALAALNKCDLPPALPDADGGVQTATCDDFQFNGKQVPATFYFINKKLMRLGFFVGTSTGDFFAYARSLRKKYGKASGDSENFAAYEHGRIDNVALQWKTIALRMRRTESGEFVVLVYTDPNFDEALQNEKAKSVEKDL
ncbi:MAG: hypothetical protein ACHQ49_05970 [Elusimicrobiota bacterium]